MNRKKIIIVTLLAAIIGIGSIVYYIFNKPHKDVQSAKTEFSIEATAIVNEYLSNAEIANEKYLNEDGFSKILEITGTVFSISEDFNNQKVILLKSPQDKAGVSVTFTNEARSAIEAVQKGDKIKIKGIIRSGASYDKDLGFYEHVIIEKAALLNNW